jgi:hypothetical protein
MSDPNQPEHGSEYGQQPPYSDQPSYGPAYPQQPPGYQQPPPGQQPPPYGQQPPAYPHQPSGYGQPPPGYGQPGTPYGQQPDQHTVPYGQPLYPGPEYGPPGQYGPAGPPQYPGAAPAGTGGGRRRGLLISAVIALLAALAVGAFFLFSGGSASAASPRDAVKGLLDAGLHNDLSGAKKYLCAADNRIGMVNQLGASGRLKSYTINSVTQDSPSRATVDVTLRTSDSSTPQNVPLPVVKDGDAWKVCFTDLPGAPGRPVPSGPASHPGLPVSIPPISIPPISIPPISNLPSGIPTNPCAYISDPQTVAEAYVGAAEIGQIDIAQACVFQNSVARSLTASLAAQNSQLYAPTGSNGSTYEFATLDGHTHLAVTVTKESDGSYYVTHVVKS